MRNALLFSLGVMSSASAFAQLPVSQTAENKKVILEEFTGVNCTFCPHGHLLANQLMADNPGNAFAINVHAGSYANTTPDFRTPFGDNLASQSGLTGYPAGTINRHLFSGLSMGSGTAMSRYDWETAADQIMSEASYVNVAVEGEVDPATRVLTVDVEMFFTGAAPSNVKLNVALLQDHIEGPQSGGSTYNPDNILPNGNYEHNHMLRHLLTGQWGEDVTTSQGTVISKTYTYTIPADLNSVAINLDDLELVAFVAESSQEIISGNNGPVHLALGNGIEAVDVSADAPNLQGNDYCMSSVTPTFDITNNSTTAIDTFEVSYDVNGGNQVTEMVYTTVAGGATYTHTFSPIMTTPGVSFITYNIDASMDVTSQDLDLTNNETATGFFVANPNPFATELLENFESYAVADYPDNAVQFSNGSWNVFVIDNSAFQVSQQLGGHGNSAKSYLWNFYSMPIGASASVVWEKIDLSTHQNSVLSFTYAYAQYSSENCELRFEASTDCGASWTTLWSQSGSSLATASPTTSSYAPATTEWQDIDVDVSSLDGQNEVMIRATGISDYGNNLFLDDINLSSPTSAEAFMEEMEFTVFPNPSNGLFNISTPFDLENNLVTVYNQLGEVVYTSFVSSLQDEAFNLNLDHLPTGMYQLNIQTQGMTQSKSIMIKH